MHFRSADVSSLIWGGVKIITASLSATVEPSLHDKAFETDIVTYREWKEVDTRRLSSFFNLRGLIIKSLSTVCLYFEPHAFSECTNALTQAQTHQHFEHQVKISYALYLSVFGGNVTGYLSGL